MQKFIFLIQLCLVSILSYPASVVSKVDQKAGLILITKSSTGLIITLEKFIKLKPGEYKIITGVKLSLKKTLALKLIQVKIKKGLRKGQPVNLYLSKTGPRKKPKLWVALLIVLGLAILFFSIAFLIAGQVY